MRLPSLLTAAFLVAIPSAALAAWPVSGIVVADRFYYRFRAHGSVFPDGKNGVIATASPGTRLLAWIRRAGSSGAWSSSAPPG